MKILVADDSPVLRAAVTKLLEPEGYEVVVAADGVEAITVCFEEQPDLVLLDISMPKLTGYVVCRLLKEDPAVAHIPILILTMRDSEEDRYWGVQSGADGYLTKDALGEGLVAAIRSVLATKALSALTRPEEPSQPILGEADVLTRVCEMLDRKLFEATVVNEITAIGNRSLTLEASIDEVLMDTRRLVAFDMGAIVIVDDLKVVTRFETDVAAVEFEWIEDRIAAKLRSVAGHEVDGADLSVVELGPGSLGTGGQGASGEWGSFYAVPLAVRGDLVGLFVLACRNVGNFGGAAMRTLRTIEPAIAAVVESAVRYQAALAKEAASSLSSLFG